MNDRWFSRHRKKQRTGANKGRPLFPWLRRPGPLLLTCSLFLSASCAMHSGGRTAAGGPPRAGPAPDETAAAVPVPPGVALALSIDEAILMGLERNRALRVERIRPEILRLREDEERARFEPMLSGMAGGGRETTSSRAGGDLTTGRLERTEASLDLSQPLATGASVGLDAGWRRDDAADLAQHRLQVGVTAAQPLLRGRGTAVNRATIHQAQIDTQVSLYEQRAFTEALVADIENACWDYALAMRRMEIVRESASLAEQQLHEVERRIEVGALAETERAAARTEVALRNEALINARSAAEILRLRILRLLDPPGAWDRALVLLDEPALPDPLPLPEDAVMLVARALRLRPELRQARLAVERGELDVVRTRNGLLPRLDLFVRLGQTAYAESFSDAAGEAEASPDWSAGIRVEIPLGRGAERARHARTMLTVHQAREALANLEQLVRLDVLTAAIEMDRSSEQISATAATRALLEETLRAEEQKFRVGRSTSLLVAQAQRDVMAGRIAEIEAVTLYLKARVRLHRLEGTLLDRLGLNVDE